MLALLLLDDLARRRPYLIVTGVVDVGLDPPIDQPSAQVLAQHRLEPRHDLALAADGQQVEALAQPALLQALGDVAEMEILFLELLPQADPLAFGERVRRPP